VYADDAIATCYATTMGTYAIVAEIRDDPYEADDELWLQMTKFVGYLLSIVLLLALILSISTSAQLWNMFQGRNSPIFKNYS
jgi:hypothetical protein